MPTDNEQPVVKQYKVICAHTINDLELLVTDKLNQGWLCTGGICTEWEDRPAMYMQSMYKPIIESRKHMGIY